MSASLRQKGTEMKDIPILDLADYLSGREGSIDNTASELRYALEKIGFFYIVNHGFPTTLIQSAFAEVARFHAQPYQWKQQFAVNDHHCGYIFTGAEVARSSEYHTGTLRPDVVEAFMIKRDRAPVPIEDVNQWPGDLPGFRETLVEYFEAAEALFRRILPIFAVSLELAPDHFNSMFGQHEALNVLRASHYPHDVPLAENQFHISPHTDSGFITMLPLTDVPGLELLSPAEKDWFPAPYVPNSFVINSGDLMKRWTNGRFLSTPHRVLNDSGRDRYALPLFVSPNPDAVIECLPTCESEDNPPKEPPITSAAYQEWFMKKNFQHAAGDDWNDVLKM